MEAQTARFEQTAVKKIRKNDLGLLLRLLEKYPSEEDSDRYTQRKKPGPAILSLLAGDPCDLPANNVLESAFREADSFLEPWIVRVDKQYQSPPLLLKRI